ncbi:hypothetical protein PG911_05935 [Tenacibaculum ovolyticum]|uniref:hypothetical protein n=1 Tax=Tenacibaculum ovolyticum TaxID=104270 RepID=UPI0022F3BAB7|nr:hypothetical protein [Tenacibaculum ovolyticum]WBX77798.1 hypothetical protein PG911_05935 [Tenacibaculum ovolyticum]
MSSTFFKKQKVIAKIIIYLFFLASGSLLTLLVFVYLWNSSPDYNQQKQIVNSWNIKIVNNLNKPIENALIIDNIDTIISNAKGYVNFHRLRSNSVIVQAKGYVSDTIYINQLTENKIYLLKSTKK